MKNLFISESSVGTHYDKAIMEELNCDFLSFTFYPVPNSKENIIEQCYLNFSNVVKLNGTDIKTKLNMRYYSDIAYFIAKEYKNSIIYIGYDLDEMGELMSGVLYYKLIANGLIAKKIVRIPLIEIGYEYLNVAFCEFANKCDIETYLKAIKKENELIKRTGAGFRKNFIIDLLLHNKANFVANINPNGTNTATYITNYLLNND